MDKKRKELGRGLSALLGDDAKEFADLSSSKTDRTVAITELTPCPFQPRRNFADVQIAELSQSIREKGILQPLVVRPKPDSDGYEIICGERRWRAAQMASVHHVPVVVRDLTDQEALEIALIENLQREDLLALEEAAAYQRLMAEFDHTQDAMAQSIGKSRSHVANMVRLLNLPDGVKAMLADGRLSAGHGRALLGAKNPADLAATVVKNSLNVRATEALVRRKGETKPSKPTTVAPKDADTLSLERELTDALGLKTKIHAKGVGGEIRFSYASLDELDGLIARLR
jgi:ParB family transcriptional regulator, chromosome partitioning protein